jgi:hypothetical protein
MPTLTSKGWASDRRGFNRICCGSYAILYDLYDLLSSSHMSPCLGMILEMVLEKQNARAESVYLSMRSFHCGKSQGGANPVFFREVKVSVQTVKSCHIVHRYG